MNPVISDLASLIEAKRKDGEKFVLMLGAGASISSGVKPTAAMQEEILNTAGKRFPGEKVEDRFDAMWSESNPADRELYLRPYLNVKPGAGYNKLARLIKAGYFDLALSFNFDDLLKDALDEVDFHDYLVIRRGETIDEEMQKLIDAKEPRFKLVKLHGSVKGSKHFLFDSEEMYRYPPPIETMVNLATSRDMLVCGYAFNDLCVIRSFADQGGSIVNVNPGGVPKGVRVMVKNRKSESWAIKDDFDTFFADLHKQLVEPVTLDPGVRLQNPFKFLESYEDGDGDIMIGREEEAERFMRSLGRAPTPQVVVISGQRKVGKTSFVRARLAPRIAEGDKYQPYYIRCQPDLEVSLPRQLGVAAEAQNGANNIAEALSQVVAKHPDRHVVVFLDQFDRVTSRFNWQNKEGRNDLSAYLSTHLWGNIPDRMTIAPVISDETTLGGWLCEECKDANIAQALVMCLAFDSKEVLQIVQTMAKNAGYEFESTIFDDMATKYDASRNSTAPDRVFTLAHIQAICHLLAGKQKVDFGTYEVVVQNMNALHQAINVVDIITWVEDLGLPDDAAWLRNIIKVPLKESKERIAAFIRRHYDDIRPGASRRPAGGRQPANGAGIAP